MLGIVHVTFPGSTKRYAYLTREPAAVGDFAVVNTPYSGICTVPIVAVDECDYEGSMKWVDCIVLNKDRKTGAFVAPVDWTQEKFCVLNVNGSPARGEKWNDTLAQAEARARTIIREDHIDRRQITKLVILKTVALIGMEEPAINVTHVRDRKAKTKKRK